jgi:hypothetical protein
VTDLERLKLMIGQHGSNTAEPVLDDAELQQCLDESRIRDINNLYVGDADYEVTYDFHRAAAKAYRAKAAIVSSDYDLQIEGRGLMRSQMVRNLLELARDQSRQAQPRAFQLEKP